MAKWDNKKLETDIEDAKKKDDDPPVPVTTPKRKLTREETIRRYDRG
jgi:hypothetical protein